ncbi:MAG: hypothetical protein HQL54_06235 [Magnetococcales bacterium]|nr:hypothetical protein [Magnetococcales bacterium]
MKRRNKNFILLFGVVVALIFFFFTQGRDLLNPKAQKSDTHQRQSEENSLVAQGRQLARACMACHDFKSSKRMMVGPPLWNIYHMPAAQVPDFVYSRAHKDKAKSGCLVWNESNLDRYLDSPRTFIPGNRMAFSGMHNKTDRRALIAFIKTMRDDRGMLASLPPESEQMNILRMSASEPALMAQGAAESRRCVACHDLSQAKKNGVGPHLWGIVGRGVANVDGFCYSKPLLKKAAVNHVWDDAALFVFLKEAHAYQPGSGLRFEGIENKEVRAGLVGYLRTLQ